MRWKPVFAFTPLRVERENFSQHIRWNGFCAIIHPLKAAKNKQGERVSKFHEWNLFHFSQFTAMKNCFNLHLILSERRGE